MPVFVGNPGRGFVLMTTFGPVPEPVESQGNQPVERILGRDRGVVAGPTSNKRIQLSDELFLRKG